jgi:hypothetical protein
MKNSPKSYKIVKETMSTGGGSAGEYNTKLSNKRTKNEIKIHKPSSGIIDRSSPHMGYVNSDLIRKVLNKKFPDTGYNTYIDAYIEDVSNLSNNHLDTYKNMTISELITDFESYIENEKELYLNEDKKIVCSKCGWDWKLSEGGDDPYTCHKCGNINENKEPASRPKKLQDTNSPTGFESSPNPNMYTKTMKFKIVDPKDRINSKDLWNPKKGQPKFDSFPQSKKVYEIKVNKPIPPYPGDEKFDDWFYEYFLNFDEGTQEDDDMFAVINKWKFPLGHIEDGLLPGLSKINDDNKIGFYKDIINLYRKFNPKDRIIFNNLNEGKYSKFRKKTQKRPPHEQLHMAVREIQMKMDEVNRLVDFTSKMKQELKEDESGLKYLKRTKNSIAKIQEKVQQINNKIKTLIE